MKMIHELKQIKKEDLFKPIEKPKTNTWDKILNVLGYGKKR